jgi:photosystem II stability/assembly factor-like uncharacterized protein
VILAGISVLALGWASPLSHAQWALRNAGTKARLRGLGVVDSRVVWASGTGGTVIRTGDGGATWHAVSVPDAKDLDFRDIHAVDDRAAYVLSIGEGERSRIYKTADAGKTWALLHVNRHPKGFLDALAFWDLDHGIALGDPVEGRFEILVTDDSGATWKRIRDGAMPAAQPGEGAFAASGTCLFVRGQRNAWFATGGAKTVRVFRSTDRGRTWSVHETPMSAGNSSSGIFSLAFRDEQNGIAVGGDFRQPERSERAVCLTSDGGLTWRLPTGHGLGGYRSAAVYVPGAALPTVVAVGPAGSDISTDDGESWAPLGRMGFHAAGFASPDAGWAVGEEGAVAKSTKLIR